MSMSTYVEAIKPADLRFEQMSAIWKACHDAEVSVPKEVELFFEGLPPDPQGVVVSLQGHPAVKKYQDEFKSGLEVELGELPKDIKIIRFVNSW